MGIYLAGTGVPFRPVIRPVSGLGQRHSVTQNTSSNARFVGGRAAVMAGGTATKTDAGQIAAHRIEIGQHGN